MFGMTPVKVPILGIVENMAYFTPEELPENKYYLFGKGGGKTMADELKVPFLGEVPIYMGIREGGDSGKPATLQLDSPIQKSFMQIAERVAQQIAVFNAQKS
jgi:ATP-binding protein involved in chromosome partitioning